MRIDDTLIDYLQELSRLELSAAEREDAKENLSKILGYMGKLDELDTEGVAELSHPFPETNRFREDECVTSYDRACLLAGAPQQKDGCFRVPKTVE